IQIQESADREIVELSEAAATAVRRGAELIQRVLAFARQQPLNPRDTDVNRLISDMVLSLPQLLGGPITVSLRKAEGRWPGRVDPGQLAIALVSSALNARDAMPRGGRLTIETANRTRTREEAERLGDMPSGDYVAIAVGDEGCGMAPEVAQRAF